jgi:hypothetical protein
VIVHDQHTQSFAQNRVTTFHTDFVAVEVIVVPQNQLMFVVANVIGLSLRVKSIATLSVSSQKEFFR